MIGKRFLYGFCFLFLCCFSMAQQQIDFNDVAKSLNLNEAVYQRLSPLYTKYKERSSKLREASSFHPLLVLREQHLLDVAGFLSKHELHQYKKLLSKFEKSKSDKVKHQLNLTEEQKKKFEAVERVEAKMLAKQRVIYEGNRDNLRTALKIVRAKKEKMVKAILTEKQYGIYQKTNEKPKKRRH